METAISFVELVAGTVRLKGSNPPRLLGSGRPAEQWKFRNWNEAQGLDQHCAATINRRDEARGGVAVDHPGYAALACWTGQSTPLAAAASFKCASLEGGIPILRQL